jgi:hypothetical protein
MKNLKIIIGCIVIFGIFFGGRYLFLSEFKAGTCVKDNRDGYIWQVNSFSFGTYRIMGWQGNAWGNSVEMKKNVLEGKDIDGIKVNNETRCPQYQLQ